MFLRATPAILALTLAVGLVGCSSAPTAQAPAASATTPASAATASGIPGIIPTPAQTAAPTWLPDTGNVNAPVTPALSIEPVGALAIRATLADAGAKAWRVTVTGTGAHAADAWTLSVETGDVAPVITTIDTLGGVAGEPEEQVGLEAGGITGRVCSVAVPVCVRAASLVLPHDGDGTLVMEMAKTDPAAALSVTGATAGWPTDPFVLGPWTTTEAFPWGA